MNENDTFLQRWLRLKREAAKRPADAAPVDLASLPSLESLTRDSDIGVFLQLGVPPDMVREALRIAWRLDPGVRDFIGIAESQWDFNDPDAMPGFGPLEPMDSTAAVVQLSTPTLSDISEAPAETTPNRNPQRDGQLDPVWLSGEPSKENLKPYDGTEPTAKRVTTTVGVAGTPRSHGGALPEPRSGG
jgi:Protein of unknown function (DUF3306)